MTVIAIDFGTSNTVVCMIDPVTQAPRTLKFEGLSRRFEAVGSQVNVVPSLVFVQQNQLIIGEQVRSQRLGFSQPERLFQGFKRDLVADYRPPARQIDGTLYTPETICHLFLQQIWQQLLQQQDSVTRAIFTVPVGAFERYLDWFHDLASKLGIHDVQLVDESTAAALGYAVKRPGSVVLVIDFGGGTLDLSLIRTVAADSTKRVLRAEVLAKSDAYLGGVDIDVWIVEHYLRQINSSREEIKEVGWQNLLEVAEKLKIRLTSAVEATESWFDDENFFAHDLHLTQTELAEILEERQLLDQLRQAIDEVLAHAIAKGVKKAEIEQVLLVGGSCQILAVQQLVNSYFGRNKVKLDKPFEAVAQGALALGFVEVEDYLRHSYALRLWEPYARHYSYFTLFDKGLRYPCVRAEPLILQAAVDGQREIRLDLGEVADVSTVEVTYDTQGRMTSRVLNQQDYFRPLSRTQAEVCVAYLEPPGKTGVDRIEAVFEVSAQRVLLVTVRDLLTGRVIVEKGAIAKLQ